ncbi:hypothetical protein DUNSADRAFT_7682 [Dunaliella salina]|uniref:Smr domain-containing protein n=1 Tax=Dunaliella salina TaxID=3046 RepID=A0ABQ7H694_DUNSA|nr:hypothetical protein DUNSADRAFT_7682 [Dunaliella salina]|eukprot:KAF5842368.1 hypothetical protein DUNSADRAFT_7682 [Dunaliella salina]
MGGARGGAPDLGLDGFMGEAHVGVTDHAAPHSFRKPGGRHNGHVALDSESAFPALGSTSNISKIGSNGGGYCSSGVAKEGGGSDGSGQCSGAVASGKETLREESGGSATRKGPWVEAAKQGASKAGGAQQQQQQEQQHRRQQSLLQRLRPLSSSPAPAGQHARASTSAAAEVRALACAQHIPWVETGDAVSKQYADARSEARDWCRLRNHCFQQATLAYCSGNKALAKELSIKGRNAADKMWEAHASAADTILAARNAKHRENRASMYQISCGAHPHFVDLHGLHVQEALALIAEFLEEGTSAPAQGQRGNVLRVCVGTGHHTIGPTANAPRLAAAVVNALKDWGVRFRALQPGLLEILL